MLSQTEHGFFLSAPLLVVAKCGSEDVEKRMVISMVTTLLHAEA